MTDVLQTEHGAEEETESTKTNGQTTVSVSLSDETLRDIDELARRKGITRTEAVAQAVATTKRIADIAPNGAKIVPR